jgi:hypothetical protein
MVIDEDYQIADGKNAGTFGPITVNSTVTVPDGQTWTVVGGGGGETEIYGTAKVYGQGDGETGTSRTHRCTLTKVPDATGQWTVVFDEPFANAEYSIATHYASYCTYMTVNGFTITSYSVAGEAFDGPIGFTVHDDVPIRVGGGGGGGGGGGVTSIIAGDGISVDQPTGAVTITNTGGGGDATPGVRYQSGTWTPAFSGSQGDTGTSVTDVMSSTPATWTRVGNQVTVAGWIALTQVGNLTGNACLKGVPYPADNGYYSGSVQFWQIASPASDMGLTITGNFPESTSSSVALFRAVASAEATMQQPTFVNEINSGSNVIFTLTYFTDDTSFSPATGSNISEDTQGIGGGGAAGVRYQQGAWTPNLQFSVPGSYVSSGQSGSWTRIGNQVILLGNSQPNVAALGGASGVLQITDLPYPCADTVSGTALDGYGYVSYMANTTGLTQMPGVILNSTDQLLQFSLGDNASLTSANLAQSFSLRYVVVYITDDTTFVPGTGASVSTNIQGGGGSGGGSGSGADAWCSFNGFGDPGEKEILASYNVKSVTRVEGGTYDIEFITPLASADYCSVTDFSSYAAMQTVNGYRIVFDQPVNPGNFAVFSSNTVAPQAGVGADAWADVAQDGTVQSGFNIGNVTKTSTGIYKVAFATPMPSNTYAITTAVNAGTGTVASINTSTKTAADFEVSIYNPNGAGTLTDRPFSFAVFASSTITPTFTWTRDGTTVKTANDGDFVALEGPSGRLSVGLVDGSSNTQKGVVLNNANPDSAGISLQAYSSSNAGSDAMNIRHGTNKTWAVKYDGTTTSSNAIFSLDPDDPTKVLDVKALLLEFQSKIETLEAAKASLEARITTLEGGSN